jgi:hypothetical protein
MAVKPLDWLGWRQARARMGEIWDGWAGRYRREARDRAMIASLRRGKVPYRGEAHEPGWRNYPVGLRVVLAGLVSLPDDLYYPYLVTNVVEYQVSELVSVSSTADLLPPLPGPAIGFQGPSLRTFTRKAELVGFELALGAFYDDLVRYGLPAGAEPKPAGGKPKRAPGQRRGGPKPTTKRPRRGKRRHGPKAGTTGFVAADEALCPVIDRLIKKDKLRSPTAAAGKLEEKKKIVGTGSAKSRVTRVVRHYWRWKKRISPG